MVWAHDSTISWNCCFCSAAWIIRNWPHVVEYQEINRTLTTGTWGADPQLLTELLTRGADNTLDHAIRQNEPWLRAALNLIADGDKTQLDHDAVAWLAGLAAVRADNGTPATAPLELLQWPPSELGGDVDIAVSDDYGIDL